MDLKERLLLFIIIILGILLRFYKLDLFEFKYDELKSILMGLNALEGNWWIKHGMMSGVGIPNAPAYSYIMAFFAYISKDPYYITMIFTILNCCVLLFALPVFAVFVSEKKHLLLCMFLFSFSPYLIIYSRKIWQSNLLLIFLLPLIVLCLNVIKKPYLLPVIGIFSSIVFQLHQSGPFLVGFLAIFIIMLFYSSSEKKTDNKLFLFIVCAVIVFFALMLPYLDFLINDGGYRYLFSHKKSNFIGGNVSYTILHTATGSSFWLYHIQNLKGFYSWPVAGLPVGVLIFANVLIIPFILGLYVSLKEIRFKKGNKIFPAIARSHEADFMVIGSIIYIIITYFVLAIWTVPHYYVILFPFLIIILSKGIFKIFDMKIKNIKYLKSLVIMGLISYALQYPFLLSYMSFNNGELREYGITYREQKRISKVINESFKNQKNISLNGIFPEVDAHIPYRESKIRNLQETIKFIMKNKYDKNVSFIIEKNTGMPSLKIKNHNKTLKLVLN